MTDSISKADMLAKAKLLHQKIAAWGRAHGVWAYRVVQADGNSFFEIFNPATKRISHDFPPKIAAAIARHAAGLRLYAAETLRADEIWKRKGTPEVVTSSTLEDRGADCCDCNAETRSEISADRPNPAPKSAREILITPREPALTAATAAPSSPGGLSAREFLTISRHPGKRG